MAEQSIGRIAAKAGRALGTLSVAAHRRPALVLTLVAAVSVFGWFGAKRLSLNADLIGLLPVTFPSVKNVEELKERFGAIGYVAVVAKDADPADLRRFADDLAPKLEALETIKYVEYRRPKDFFEEHALYYLDVDDLEEVLENVEERADYARKKANPLLVDLEDTGPPEFDFEALKKKYSARFGGGLKGDSAKAEYYIDAEKRIAVLLAKPAVLSSQLDFAKKVVGEVEGVVQSLDLSTYGPNLHIIMAGGYTKKVEQQKMIESDLQLSTITALLLILLYLGIHFRRVGAVVLIMVPLMVGLVWSFGYAGWVFGQLNILTGFIGAILIGLGIDNGIHLLGRYERERTQQASSEEALRRTFADTGRAAVVAAATTMVAFGGLGISEFRAFREFGLIAAVAMFLLITAYVVTLPALLGVAERIGWQPRPNEHNRVFGAYARVLPRISRGLAVVSILVIAVAGYGFPRTPFDFNFRNLVASNTPSFQMDAVIDGILGYSQTPVVVLTNSPDEERFVANALRERKKSKGEASTVQLVAASAEFIPLEQEEKFRVIRKMAKVVDQVDPATLGENERKDFARFTTMTKATPFQYSSLPVEVRRRFEGPKANAASGFVLIYPAVDLSDGAVVNAFADEVRDIPLPDGERISAAGEAMVMADVFSMVVREAPPALLITLGLVILTSLVLLGSIKATFLALLPAVVTVLCTLGLLIFTDLKVNYLNIVMIPVLFGIGVDGGAHIVTRVYGGASLTSVVEETGHAIAGAIFTTALGFSALLLADHRGLDSLGEFALFGLLMNFLSCLVFLPAFAAEWMSRGRVT